MSNLNLEVPEEELNKPTEPVVEKPAEEPEESPEQKLIREQGDMIASLNDKLDEIKEQVTPKDPDPEPVDPKDDPEYTPPKNWKEQREETREIARKAYEDSKAEEEKVRESEKAAREALDKEYDAAIDELQEAGIISAIEDPNSPTDLGRVQRAEIFGLAAYMQTPDIAKVGEILKGMWEKNAHFDFKNFVFVDSSGGQPSAQQPSRGTPPPTAPVGSSSGRSGGATQTKPDYKTIHNARDLESLRDIAGI